jgi:hypothetical protein
MTAADILRQALAAFGSPSPGIYEPKAAHDLIVRASKGALKGDPVVVAMGKLFTKSRGGVNGATYAAGGPDQLLQACLREPAETGLPALAEAVLATWPTPILVPVFRQPAGWDAKARKDARQPHDASTPAAFTPDGKEAVTAGTNGKLARWSLETGALLDSFWMSRLKPIAVWVLASERVVAFGHKESGGVLLAAGGGKPMVLLTVNESQLAAPTLSADGKFLAVQHFRGFGAMDPPDQPRRHGKGRAVFELTVYEVATSRVRHRENLLGWEGIQQPRPALFLPDGRLLVGLVDTVSVRSAPDFEEVARWKVARAPAAFCLSPDGARLTVEIDEHCPPLCDTEGTRDVVLDTTSGKTVKVSGAMAYVDAQTGLQVNATSLAVFDVASAATTARYVVGHPFDAAADPKTGAIVVTSRSGAGPTEVLRLQRPPARKPS